LSTTPEPIAASHGRNTPSAGLLRDTTAFAGHRADNDMVPSNGRSQCQPPCRRGGPIRRFDVFAEYTRQERREQGAPDDQAKGYGIWLAKVVAARRFSRRDGAASATTAARQPEIEQGTPEPKFRSVGDELQTDATFDREIIARMGERFYQDVFVPAIAEARARGARCEAIRDRIRAGWKASKPAA
jgi:hypothetical protein